MQGADAAAVAKLVKAAGGTVTHELGIIRAVAADLTLEQVAELRRIATSPRIYRNRPVRVSGASGGNGKISDTLYPTLVAADLLHDQGIDGSGVTVAVLDTGFWSDDAGVTENPSGQNRVLVKYDAIEDRVVKGKKFNDSSGHGAHVTAIAVSSRERNGKYNGLAPGAELVAVKAFAPDGSGSYADVIRGLDWVVANKDAYGIRVLNLSFSAQPTVPLLGRPAEPGRDGCLAGGDRGRGLGGQHRTGPDDHRRAGQCALHRHGGRDDRWLHARRSRR